MFRKINMHRVTTTTITQRLHGLSLHYPTSAHKPADNFSQTTVGKQSSPLFSPYTIKSFMPARHLTVKCIGRTKTTTTGWDESNRNLFHPGDIITALRLDYACYSPHALIGLTELVIHLKGKGRETCQPYIDEKGRISGFYYNVVLGAEMLQGDLREAFPEIAKYADSFTKESLEGIVQSPEKITHFIKEIEAKFGKTIEVKPSQLFEDKKVIDHQYQTLSNLKSKGKKIIVIEANDEPVNAVRPKR